VVDAFTPSERRGALVVVLLLALGGVRDLWLASRPAPIAALHGAGVAGRAPSGTVGPGPSVGGEGDAPRPAIRPDAAILDLNRASSHELESLPGVGPVLAGRIVTHRARHGPFRRPEELMAVRGIGPRLFGRLRPHVRVEPLAAPAPADAP
jgi:competence protein ComEA